jgi:hypothetical protein
VKSNHSWLALLSFCITPALVVALSSAALFAGAAVAFALPEGGKPGPAAQEANNPRDRVFAGVITDDHCGARHVMDSDKNPTDCARMCVRNGSRYVLVQGDKRYALAGNESQFEGLAGQRVNVTGMLDGNTIKVSSTSPGP